MQKLSHDGKFTISFAETDDKSFQKVSVSTEKAVSEWEITHAIYIDCVCEPRIDADKLQFDVKTKTTNLKVTVPKLSSVQEVFSTVCNSIKN